MCSAEMQASISRCRWRWRIREPPLLPAAEVEVRGPLKLLSVAVRQLSLSRTIGRGDSRNAHHESTLASGPLADHPAAAHFPADILSHPVPFRLQDQLRRGGAARAAFYRRNFLHARSPSAPGGELWQLPLPADR